MFKAFIDSKNSFFYNQISQLLYGIPIQIHTDIDKEKDIIITDGQNPKIYDQSESNAPIHIPVFTVAETIPEVIPEEDKRRFYVLGELDPERFISEVQNWISVWDFISTVIKDDAKNTEECNRLKTKVNGYEIALTEAKKYQKNAMICPQTDRFQYSLLYQPAFAVSGDFFNTFVTKDNAIFVIGDVVNHGIGAALVGASFQTMIDLYMDLHPDADLIELANYVQNHDTCYHKSSSDPEYSIQALFVQIKDQMMSLLSFGSGGEPAILIQKQEDGTYQVICTNLIEKTISRLAEHKREITEDTLVKIPFHAGDGLVLYSDGITEAFSHNQQEDAHFKKYQYSKEGIIASITQELALQHGKKWTPEQIIKAVQDDLDNYIQSDLGEEQAHSHDDVTMLVIQDIGEETERV